MVPGPPRSTLDETAGNYPGYLCYLLNLYLRCRLCVFFCRLFSFSASQNGVMTDSVSKALMITTVLCFFLSNIPRFLYTGHHIVGLNHVMSQSNDSTANSGRCVLLQPDGIIKNLTVPFHCALR